MNQKTAEYKQTELRLLAAEMDYQYAMVHWYVKQIKLVHQFQNKLCNQERAQSLITALSNNISKCMICINNGEESIWELYDDKNVAVDLEFWENFTVMCDLSTNIDKYLVSLHA